MAGWHFCHGSMLLADDVTVITFDSDGQPRVIPSYPHLKLWQGSLDLLGLSNDGLRRVWDRMDKFSLPIGDQFCRVLLPLTEITEIVSEGALETLQGVQKFATLLTHSYRHYFLRTPRQKFLYSQRLADLVARVTVTRQQRLDLARSRFI